MAPPQRRCCFRARTASLSITTTENQAPLGGEIAVKGFIVEDAQEQVNEAFDALDWPLKRALGELRKALGS
jgi:hypothetical protein